MHHATHTHPAGSAEAVLMALPRPIAVVGNGQPARAFGALIDRYASVLRLENFATRGLEDRVGSRTTLRVTAGADNAEVRHGVRELSPWHVEHPASAELPAYRQRGGQAPTTAACDIGERLRDIAHPSTGLALLALCDELGIEVDAFAFDDADEAAHLLAMPCVTLMGPAGDATLAPPTHDTLCSVQELGIRVPGERVLVFGLGDGRLAQWLQQQGSQVTAMDPSAAALAPLQVHARLQAEPLDLMLLALREGQPFDRFVAFATLDRLGDHAVRLALRGAADACRSVLVSVSTQPGDDAVSRRTTAWWLLEIGRHFVVNNVVPGAQAGEMLFEGHARRLTPDHEGPAPKLPRPPHDEALELPPGYRARAWAEPSAPAAPPPDVHPTAAKLAQSLGCSTIVDLGCGDGRSLLSLPHGLELIGVDDASAITRCRQRQPRGTWIEADFDAALPLPIPRRTLADAVVVCANLIERVADPVALLALMQHLLRDAAAVVLATPDRVRTHGPAENGPSPIPSRTREWTLTELSQLFERAGFKLAMLTHTRSDTERQLMATTLAVAINPEHKAVKLAQATPADAWPAAEADPVRAPTAPALAPHPMPPLPAARLQAQVDTSDALLDQASQCLADGDIAAFQRLMAQLLELEPGHAGARRLIAGLQLSQGDPAEAANLYDELIADGHRDAEVLEGVVLAHWRAGDVRAAAQRMLTHA